MPRLLADLTPLRVSQQYRRLWAGLSLANVGTQLAVVAVGLQVYDLSGSSLSVGLVGLFALIPLVLLGLYGGSIVDAHDRRKVALAASIGLWVVAVLIALQAWLEVGSVWLLYGLVAAQSACFAINNPARSAILPRLLPLDLLPAANALQSLSWNLGFTVGPLLAGFLIGKFGYGVAYTVDAVGLGIAVWTLFRLPPLPPEGEVRRAGLRSVLEGLRFLGTRPNVRMTFLVDMAAMVLAQPRAIFPAVGAVLLGGGPTTVGILSAAVAAGSMLAALLSGPLGHVRRQGLVTVWAVIGWGVSIAGFGVVVAIAPRPGPDEVSGWLWVAALALAFAGASDAVSAVFRTTILQAATPDVLRGRLQGVFIVVVAGGPRLGDLLAGGAADALSVPVAVIGGGVLCCVAVVLLARFQPRFVAYDARHPTP
ncbi:MAG TPA: MFS transporter [Actinomycetales bacterium]|nr:MFS transporter [Actinomycetales bacterium]